MRFGICNEIFKSWKIDDAIAYVARLGYHAFEIAPFTLARYVTQVPPDERSRVRRLAEQANIGISGIHWVLVEAEGMYLTHPDAVVRERTADYFCELVNFCADLGGKTIVVGSPKQRNLMEGISPEQGKQWALDVFRPSVRRAEQRSVTICFEPLAPSETNFINRADEAIDFIGGIESPNFRIILDVKAMCSESKPIPEIIRSSWPHFAYFHANDKNLKGPGMGDVDFRPIAAALKEVGYDGVVSVEVFDFSDGPEAIAERSLNYLQKVFGA